MAVFPLLRVDDLQVGAGVALHTHGQGRDAHGFQGLHGVLAGAATPKRHTQAGTAQLFQALGDVHALAAYVGA